MGSQGSQKIGDGVETLRIHSDACLHACAGAGVGHSEGPGTHIECSRNSRHESSHGKDVGALQKRLGMGRDRTEYIS